MELKDIKNVDIYLLDQLLKERIKPGQKVLDAGCGSGRNFKFFLEQGYDITGIDQDSDSVFNLQNTYPNYSQKIKLSAVEDFGDVFKFDVIICNAVLHFAQNHKHFDLMFENLVTNLNPSGILFIRMTTDIGIQHLLPIPALDHNGVYDLPDKTSRYLINREKINYLVEHYNLEMLEPIKTVVVDKERSMATLVFRNTGFK
jgi:2-polyprenyl-3-methyl-5-hydroxy-6-metoxy-1,4-benzoquinol methylase